MVAGNLVHFENPLEWYATPNGPSVTLKEGIPRKNILMHRYIVEAPLGSVVDHINNNKLDNRRENLRIVNHHINSRNRSKRKDNKTGYIGIFWSSRRQKYVAGITNNYRFKCLGYFNDIQSAVEARLLYIKNNNLLGYKT